MYVTAGERHGDHLDGQGSAPLDDHRRRRGLGHRAVVAFAKVALRASAWPQIIVVAMLLLLLLLATGEHLGTAAAAPAQEFLAATAVVARLAAAHGYDAATAEHQVASAQLRDVSGYGAAARAQDRCRRRRRSCRRGEDNALVGQSGETVVIAASVVVVIVIVVQRVVLAVC